MTSHDARRRASAPRRPREAPAQRHELARRQVRVDVRVLGQKADARHRRRATGRARRGSSHRPARRRDEPHQHLDRRRLARAVRPEEAEDLPARHLEANAAHGLDAPARERLAERLREARRRGGRRRSRPLPSRSWPRCGDARIAAVAVLVQLVLDLARADAEHRRGLRRRARRTPRGSSGSRSARGRRSSSPGMGGSAVALRRRARRSAAGASPRCWAPSQSTTARSTTFSSSRTLPGQR